MFQLNFLDEWAIREALLRWPELRWRETQGPSLGTWMGGRNQTGGVHPGRATSAPSPNPPEGAETHCGGGRRACEDSRCAPPPPPPASRGAWRQDRDAERRGACKRPTACELLKRRRVLGRRCAPWGGLLPAGRGLRRSLPLRDASSRPSTRCQPRGRRCPRRDRGKFTNTNPGPASPEALSPPPRPLRYTAIPLPGSGAWTGGDSPKRGEAEDARKGV
ncbi:hypothetical protein QTO34_017514 [Cnephaeus nilssonii]|uniref:Uncharacterized protein n=1 Tax=Cnephaeus nilssonii TaxID=3371016 RepID=A0AA40I255_CNENI|nr:hypothetical protein QTO34_017514 [Eptesicus nilssonii]